jgi:hypothetical protein
MLVVSITANMKDYLVHRETDKLVEGDQKFKNHETIWSFKLVEGQWRVSNIEAVGCEFDYIFQVKSVPRIEETVLGSANPIKADNDNKQIDRGSQITGSTEPL